MRLYSFDQVKYFIHQFSIPGAPVPRVRQGAGFYPSCLPGDTCSRQLFAEPHRQGQGSDSDGRFLESPPNFYVHECRKKPGVNLEFTWFFSGSRISGTGFWLEPVQTQEEHTGRTQKPWKKKKKFRRPTSVSQTV